MTESSKPISPGDKQAPPDARSTRREFVRRAAVRTAYTAPVIVALASSRSVGAASAGSTPS